MTTATLHTNHGDIVINLFENEAPKTVANFVGLAEGTKDYTDPKTRKPGSGPFYDGVTFHRVIPNFMIQGGDRLGTGTGDAGYKFADEFHPDLAIPHAELVLRKGYRRDIDSYSAFFENDRRTPTGLSGYLRERGLKRVFLAGLALDFCVRYSAEDARRCGFEVIVAEDACRGIDVNGSVAAARQKFRDLVIPLVATRSIG